MQLTTTYWSDTGNLDLRIHPENESDKVILALIKDRTPRWWEGTKGDGTAELVFEPKKA